MEHTKFKINIFSAKTQNKEKETMLAIIINYRKWALGFKYY